MMGSGDLRRDLKRPATYQGQLILELGGRPKRGANEEATQPRSGQPNPTDPGDAADLSIPQGYL